MAALRDGLRIIVIIGKIAMILLLAGFCFSGIRNIEQYENGIILRFGAVSGGVRQQPGMVFALPYPIDEVVKLPAKRTQTIESSRFWYAETEAEQRTGKAGTVPGVLKPGIDGYLVTADRNILHAGCVLKYRINDSLSYAFGFARIEEFLRLCLDNAIVKTVGTTTIQQALTDPNLVGSIVTGNLRDRIRDLGLGVEIDPVDLRLSWPRQLAEQINTVAAATQKADQDRDLAEIFANRQRHEAESLAARRRLEARTRAKRMTSRVRADANTFDKLYPLYVDYPEVIMRTFHQDRMRKFIAGVDEVFIVNGGEGREVRFDLPRRSKPIPDPEDGR